MSLSESGIEPRHYGDTLVATKRFATQARAEFPVVLRQLAQEVPGDVAAGPAFAILHFVTSVKDGSDVEGASP